MKHTVRRFCLALLILALAACSTAGPPSPTPQLADRQLQLGSRYYQAGQLAQARLAFQRAVQAAELIDDVPRQIEALLALGASELLLGDFAAAAQSYRRAGQEAQFGQQASQAVLADIGLAEIARREGKLAEAIERYRQIEQRPELSAPQRLHLANGLGLALLASGQLEAAEQVLLGSQTLSQGQSTALQAGTLANLARLALARDQLARAEALANQALSMNRPLYHPPAIAADHQLLSEILARTGQTEAAQRHWHSAERIFRQTGQPLPNPPRQAAQ